MGAELSVSEQVGWAGVLPWPLVAPYMLHGVAALFQQLKALAARAVRALP